MLKLSQLFLLCTLLVLAAGQAYAYPGKGASSDAGTAAPAAPEVSGTVVQTINSGGYTYVRLETGDGEVWAAGPETPVAVGDRIVLSAGQVMPNFHSASLDRTFDSIVFLSTLSKPGEGGMNGVAAQAHEAAGVMNAMTNKEVPSVEAGSVPKAENGHTVAELYATKADLAGKEVAVMGRVVKYNGGIMGKNWLHVKDGSGEAGTDDLTVTTASVVQVGDLVLVQGKVTLDKDFGAGYSYDLIIEDATVTVQP
jgi:hypothetical protein